MQRLVLKTQHLVLKNAILANENKKICQRWGKENYTV